MATRTASSGPFRVEPSMRIIVLHGSDPYQITARTREVAEALRHAHGEIEQFNYDGQTATLADVLDELRSFGLIQQHKLVIVDKAELFLAADDRRRPAMEAYARNPVDSATLVLRSEAWRPGNLDKIVKTCGMVHKVQPLSDEAAVTWCIQQCKAIHKAAIEPAAATRLVEQIGAEMGRLDVELAKLAAFVRDGQTITAAHVIEMVGKSREEKVWDIQAAVVSGRPGHALQTLRDLMGVSGHPEALVIWAICDLLRKLHAAARMMRQGANPGSIVSQLKLFGDARNLIIEVARRSDPARLAQLLQAAVQSDVNSKSGLGDSTRSLEALTVQIADVIGSARR